MSALLAALLAAAAASPAPAQSAPMKTIGHVKSSPVCTEFRSLVLPLALVQRKNDGLMQIIHNETQQYRNSSYSKFRNGLLLHAANIDMAAANMLQNLALIDRALAQSWKRSPKGVNPKIDALRQRVQNVADLQRALANQETQFAGYLGDTNGFDVLAAAASGFGGRAGAPSPPHSAVQAAASAPPPPPPQDAGTAHVLPEADPRVPSTMPDAYRAADLRSYRFAALQSALQQERVSLTPIAFVLARDCDGVGP